MIRCALALACGLIAAAASPARAQIVLSGGATAPPLPTFGSPCPVRSDPVAPSRLSDKLFPTDSQAQAVRDLRVGVAQDDLIALERARAYFAEGQRYLWRNRLLATATQALGVRRADPRLLADALAALAPGLGGEESSRLSAPQRRAMLVGRDAARGQLMLLQSAATVGEPARALAAAGAQLIRGASVQARADGDLDLANDLGRDADAAAFDAALERRSWPEASAALRAIAASVPAETEPRRLRWARMTYAGVLAAMAQSDAPADLRRDAARQVPAILDLVTAELRLSNGRAPKLEERLAGMSGDVSGTWMVPTPGTAVCPLIATIEIDRAAAALALADDEATRVALRRSLAAADAMLAAVPPYRRGVFAPLVLARSYATSARHGIAGTRDQALRWYEEVERRAGACFCAQYRTTAVEERAGLAQDHTAG